MLIIPAVMPVWLHYAIVCFTLHLCDLETTVSMYVSDFPLLLEQQLWPYPAMDFSFLSTSSARLSLPRMAVISWPTDVVLRYRYSNPAGDLTPWLEQRNLSVHDTNNPSVQVTGLPSSQPIQVQLINMALSPPVVSSLLSFRTLEAGMSC